MSSFCLIVNLEQQTMDVYEGETHRCQYRVATGKKGIGELSGSEKTPRGRHKIRAKIGDNEAENTVFIGRRPTGEIYQPSMRNEHPNRDWILTRIMWLSGLEPGFNRLGNVDTMRRYVYIHGCPDEDEMGIPSSHGCVKMRNSDIIELFDLIPVGTEVLLKE